MCWNASNHGGERHDAGTQWCTQNCSFKKCSFICITQLNRRRRTKMVTEIQLNL